MYIILFQFHKGTIRTRQRFLQDDCLINFNSIKVRLEPSLPARIYYSRNYFNSIKVRLELKEEFEKQWNEFHFNSIKVRLEQGLRPEWWIIPVFQFHKGTIRT